MSTPTDDLEAKARECLRKNFDHDSDAHKYGTSCRKCVATEALSALRG